MWAKFRHKIRNIFIAGLLTVLPLTITYLVLKFLLEKTDAIVQPMTIKLLQPLYPPGHQVTNIPGLGIAVIALLLILVGIVVTNVVGKKLVVLMEAILSRIPLVRNVYTGSKQFFEAISISNNETFNKVVMVEYPRKGIYSVGFVTCESTGEPQELTKEQVVNIFIPTTPNPTSGLLIIVPKKDIIPLSMTVEEGLKLVVSGGMITPNLINKNQVNPPKKSWFRKKPDKKGEHDIQPFGDNENPLC